MAQAADLTGQLPMHSQKANALEFGETYRTRDEARADVLDYIARFYNAKPGHSTVDYLNAMEKCVPPIGHAFDLFQPRTTFALKLHLSGSRPASCPIGAAPAASEVACRGPPTSP